MSALVLGEFRKLHGSLALLLAVLAPALPGLLVALSTISASRAPTWGQIVHQFAMAIWTMFLLPMVVAAFTALVAQIEHGAKAWDHLLALPIRRWQIFVAKGIVVGLVTVAMTLLMLLLTAAGGLAGAAFSGRALQGAFPWQSLSHDLPATLAAAGLMVAIQLWVALRFKSFVVPLALGICGTLVTMAVAMTGTPDADLFPWVLPMRALKAPDSTLFVLIGGLGGLALYAVALIDLSRRSFR